MVNVYFKYPKNKSDNELYKCKFGIYIAFGEADNAADLVLDAKKDADLQNAMEHFYNKSDIVIKVRNGIIYTDKIGLVIGAKGSNIKLFARKQAEN